MEDQISINEIEFYAHHGASDEEQAIGHRYWVDVVFDVDLSLACKTDRLEDTISYSEAARLVLETGTRDRHRLMERVAAKISDALLERFPMATSVTVTLGKRLPPAKLIIESACVTITRGR